MRYPVRVCVCIYQHIWFCTALICPFTTVKIIYDLYCYHTTQLINMMMCKGSKYTYHCMIWQMFLTFKMAEGCVHGRQINDFGCMVLQVTLYCLRLLQFNTYYFSILPLVAHLFNNSIHVHMYTCTHQNKWNGMDNSPGVHT